MPWYVISIDVDTDKFLQKYAGFPHTIKSGISEVIYFRKTDKGIYERDAGGVYSGYVFMEATEAVILKLHDQLTESRLGSVLGMEHTGKPAKLSEVEIDDIRKTMQSNKDGAFPQGSKVRVTYGPYEDMEGEVIQIIGPVANVRIPLRKGHSYAEIGLDNLVLVAEKV